MVNFMNRTVSADPVVYLVVSHRVQL